MFLSVEKRNGCGGTVGTGTALPGCWAGRKPYGFNTGADKLGTAGNGGVKPGITLDGRVAVLSTEFT